MALVKDPVTVSARMQVYQRDGGCIAPRLDPNAGPCHNRWGRFVSVEAQLMIIWANGFHARRARAETLTLDHVPRFHGSKRISTPRWMVTACWGHGVNNSPGGSVWVTGHRDLERKYLADHYEGALSKMDIDKLAEVASDVFNETPTNEDREQPILVRDQHGGHLGVVDSLVWNATDRAVVLTVRTA